MVNEGTVVKVAVAPAALFVATKLVPGILHSGGEGIAFTAAVLAGTHYLWKVVRRGWQNGKDLIRRLHQGVDVIETVPGRLDKIEDRLNSGDDRFERLDGYLDVIASGDRDRINNRLAGDDRAPVDRRDAAA